MTQIPDAAVQAFMAEFHQRTGVSYEANIRASLEKTLPHLPLGYEVKKLEWSADVVNTSFGAYTISDDDEGFYFTFHDYPYGVADEARHLTANEAKEAAQSDFERRVRECHEPVRITKSSGCVFNDLGIAKPVDVAAIYREALEHISKFDRSHGSWETIAYDAINIAGRALSSEPTQGEP